VLINNGNHCDIQHDCIFMQKADVSQWFFYFWSDQMESLVIRPLPYKDESLRGYIVRASEANLYPDSKLLFRYAGLQKYNKFDNLLIPDKEIDLSKIRGLLSNENIADMLLINQLGAKEISHYEGIRFHLWRYGTCAHKQRICPKCLTETPYHRDIWELSLFIICPIHNCLMVDNCEGCGSKINPYRQSLLRCKCGFDYRRSKVEYKESSFAVYLYSRFYNDEKLPEKLNLINGLTLCSFIYLMITASRWINGTLNQRSMTNFSESIKESNLAYILDKSLSIFLEWPLNFYKFIDDIRLNNRPEKQSLASYSRFKDLIKGNLGYSQYDFIHEGLNYYLLNYLYSGFSGSFAINNTTFSKNIKRVRATTIRNHNKAFTEGTTRKEAAEILGVGLDQIDYFVARDIIKPIHGPEVDGNPYVLFNKDDLFALLMKIEQKVDGEFNPSRLITFYNGSATLS